mmetsp:Transcript_99666/g.281317  ORF Transcript_99666/g.281317 Transcript_99666/m.281317 type:complete len:459 (+) Transcript_99666:467-1843(+)
MFKAASIGRGVRYESPHLRHRPGLQQRLYQLLDALAVALRPTPGQGRQRGEDGRARGVPVLLLVLHGLPRSHGGRHRGPGSLGSVGHRPRRHGPILEVRTSLGLPGFLGRTRRLRRGSRVFARRTFSWKASSAPCRRRRGRGRLRRRRHSGGRCRRFCGGTSAPCRWRRNRGPLRWRERRSGGGCRRFCGGVTALGLRQVRQQRRDSPLFPQRRPRGGVAAGPRQRGDGRSRSRHGAGTDTGARHRRDRPHAAGGEQLPTELAEFLSPAGVAQPRDLRGVNGEEAAEADHQGLHRELVVRREERGRHDADHARAGNAAAERWPLRTGREDLEDRNLEVGHLAHKGLRECGHEATFSLDGLAHGARDEGLQTVGLSEGLSAPQGFAEAHAGTSSGGVLLLDGEQPGVTQLFEAGHGRGCGGRVWGGAAPLRGATLAALASHGGSGGAHNTRRRRTPGST